MPIIFSIISIIFLIIFIALIFKKKENIKYLFLFLTLFCLNHGFIVSGSGVFYEYGGGLSKNVFIITIFSLVVFSYFLYKKIKENHVFKNKEGNIVFNCSLKKYIKKFIILNITLTTSAWIFSGYIMDQMMFNEYSTNDLIYIFISITALFMTILFIFIKLYNGTFNNYSFKFFIQDVALCLLIIPLIFLFNIFTYYSYGIGFFIAGFFISFSVIRERKIFNFITLAMVNFFVSLLLLLFMSIVMSFFIEFMWVGLSFTEITMLILEVMLFGTIFSQNILFGFLTGLIPWWIFKKRTSNELLD